MQKSIQRIIGGELHTLTCRKIKTTLSRGVHVTTRWTLKDDSGIGVSLLGADAVRQYVKSFNKYESAL